MIVGFVALLVSGFLLLLAVSYSFIDESASDLYTLGFSLLALAILPALFLRPSEALKVRRKEQAAALRLRRIEGVAAQRARQHSALENSDTLVYRLYDGNGTLLYVGVTNDLKRRLKEHADDKPWWGQVSRARTATERFSRRSDALRREEALIRYHRPRYNYQFNR